jgi:hypothetical protein
MLGLSTDFRYAVVQYGPLLGCQLGAFPTRLVLLKFAKAKKFADNAAALNLCILT